VTQAEAVILGIIQGLTEPLPVSSSAHLVIVPALIPGFQQPDVFFDVVLHLGTLFSVLFFLRKEIADLLFSLLPQRGGAMRLTQAQREARSANRRLVGLILVATALTGSIGLLFKDRIEALFASIETTAVMLLITGVLLFLSDRVKSNNRGKGEMKVADAIVIGLVQAVALVPGISRSGSTITVGIFRGLTRETAARFSFLLSIPAIAGAVLLKATEMPPLSAGELPALGAGFLTAAITGFLALKLLFLVIHRTGLGVFAYYCWFAGLATLIARALQP
jgi:undecaprenyl-diphosphatase